MAGEKKVMSSTNPEKSSSKPKAKNDPGRDDENGLEEGGKHKLQQLPTQAEPVLLESFMKLPIEIRQMVYDFALTEDQQPVLVDRWNANTPYTRPPSANLPKLSTGVMGVCQKIRKEVGQRYYVLNAFRFIHPSHTLVDWLRDPNRSGHLRSIACPLSVANPTWYGTSCEVLRLLHLCTNLTTLNITTTGFDLLILQYFEEFKTLHGFASAEAIRSPRDDPDGEYLGPPLIMSCGIRRHGIQSLLAQLTSNCPNDCAGHARRERVEIRVLPSGMRS